MPTPEITARSTTAEPVHEQSIAACFEACARRFGDRLAIRDEQTTLTYDQLNAAANRIAARLHQENPDEARPVGLFFQSKPLFLAALLGVLKGGRFALPLDPDFPDSQNRFITDDSRAQIILSENKLIDRVSWLAPDGSTLDVSDLPDGPRAENPERPTRPDSRAMLLYTSGSTGRPKGVIHSHRSLLHNALRQAELIQFTPEDRLSMLYSTSVMGAARDYLNALTCGAGLYAFDLRTHGIGPFLDWIEEQEITILHTIPSFFRRLGDAAPGPIRMRNVRMVILGGEAPLKSDYDIYCRNFPDDCRLFTGLGSTETGTIRQNILDKDAQVPNGAIPLGYPLRDVDVLLWDPAGKPVPPGGTGEIVVRSPYLACEYWNRPELNREVFLPDPDGGDRRLFRTGDLGRFLPDGCLVHEGRKDFQVKVRGYRIELPEIESTLLATGLVREAVVTNHHVRDGDQRLVAYVVPQKKQEDAASTLRSALAGRLPGYMIPSHFIPLDALPRTPNGKVDRQSLPAPDLAPKPSASLVAASKLEQELAHLWGDILSIQTPGLDEDFFSLGGDSLHATNLFLEIERRYGVRLPLGVLLEHSTVRRLADRLASQPVEEGKSLVTIRPQGRKKPLYALPGGYGDTLYLRNLANYLDPERPLYGLQAPAQVGGRSYGWSMEKIAAAYLAEVLSLQPDGPYYLAGHSHGGYIALEMARALLAQGKRVAFLGLWDTFPPGRRRQARLHERFSIHLNNLRGLPLRKVPAYFKERWISLVLRLTHLRVVQACLERIDFTPPDRLAAARMTRYSYQPAPYPGDLLLFQVSQRPWYVRWDPMEGWKSYVQGKIETIQVQGEHGNILFEPHVRDLAQKLNEALQRTDGDEPAQDSGGNSSGNP